MPHRVATFFRQHSFELPAEKKKGAKQSPSSRPALSDRSLSSSNTSLASIEDRKMPDGHKRLSLGKHSPRNSSKSIPQISSASLSVAIESPPLLMHGSTSNSTGALLSGQLKLSITDDSMVINNFKMRLALDVTRKKPFHTHCKECERQSTDLQNWDFLHEPVVLKRGEHLYPFSFLLPGHLPASMKGILTDIDYALKGTLTTASGDTLKVSHVLNVKRAVQPGDQPRNSVRIFPPTNLTAHCTLPPVIHPIGETNLSMRIDGVIHKNSDAKTRTQWRLKRVTWRLDETQKTISPACTKHAVKLNKEDAKKGVSHQEIRTIGSAEYKDGWKSDYSDADGSIEFEFPFGIRNGHPLCDVKAEDGTEVSHVLVVEMIVTEEYATLARPTQMTPTGAARVLRMHFNVVVTERAGLGISWDEEQPPLYENVPASPPTYGVGAADEFDLPEYADLPSLTAISEASGTGSRSDAR